MKIRRKKTSQTKANKIFPDKDRFGDINYRFDNCHFNKFGTEKIAIEISKIINKLNNKK